MERRTFCSPHVLGICALGALLGLAFAPGASAQIVYSNNFELNTAGFTAGGSLTSLTRATLPIDGGGPSSPNTSTWLGKLGDGVAKSSTLQELATLSLSGLTPGHVYTVSFDLLIGASWDGDAPAPYGPDQWRFSVDGTNLVDTTFSNLQQGVNAGADSRQTYTDTNFASGTSGTLVSRFTGADFSFTRNQDGFYADDYSIYWFGHGAGNPVLDFTPGGTTATLQFARYGNTTDSPDEYWALDNVQVAAVPEPATLALLVVGSVCTSLARLALCRSCAPSQQRKLSARSVPPPRVPSAPPP
jgi:hypothetical protein